MLRYIITYIHTHIHTYTHTHIHARTRTHTCVCVCAFASACVRVCVCVCVCVCLKCIVTLLLINEFQILSVSAMNIIMKYNASSKKTDCSIEQTLNIILLSKKQLPCNQSKLQFPSKKVVSL